MKTIAVPPASSFLRRGRPRNAAHPPSRDRAAGWRRGILAVSIGVLLVLESKAGAVTSTWNGGSTVDSNFTSLANWNFAPASNNDFVFGGTLRLNANNNFPSLTMNTLTFAPGAGAFALTGNAISLTAGVTNNSGNLQSIGFGGAGVTLGAAQTWTANTATLNVTSAVNLNGSALTVAGAQNTTITGIVSGTGSLIKDGTGTLEFSGTSGNSYSGTTTVNDGTLSLNGAGATSKIVGDLVIGNNLGGANTAVVVLKTFSQIADTSNVTIHSDGQFDVGGEGETIKSLVIDRGHVVGVPMNGFGSLELTGSLDMTGGSISGGTGANFGVELLGGAGISDVTATSDAAGNVATINSNLTLSSTGGTSQVRTFTVNAGPGAVDLVINGVIQNGSSHNDGIIKAGTGTLELTRNNTYTGGTNITGGTLLADNVGGSATGAGPVTVSGGTLGGRGSVGGNVNLGSGGVIAPGAAATGISTATLTLGKNFTWDGGGTLSFELGANNAASDLLAVTGNMSKGAPGAFGIGTFGINVADAGGFGAQPNYTLIKFAGTTFTAATDFTLETLPAGYTGTLMLGANALTLQVVAVPQAFWTGGQGTVWTTNTGGNTNWATNLGGLTGTGVPGPTTDVTFSAMGAGNQSNTTLGADITIKSLTIIDPAAVTIGGPNTLTINNTAAQAVTVSSGAGPVTISANVALAGSANAITVNNMAGALISGSITGANGLIKLGTGTLTLTGNNNYTGLTFVRDGTLQLQGPTTNTMIRGALVVGDGIGAANSAVLQLLAGSQIAHNDGVTVNSDGDFISGGENIGALTVNGGTVDTGSGGGLDVASLNMTGGSVLGAKRFGLNGNVTTQAAATTATISSGAVTSFVATQTFTVAAGAAATDLLITSPIISSNGSGAVIKAGPGTLELTSGASSYSGGTMINGGTLLANNASGSATSSGAVAVNSSGTLGGNGTVTGPVTLNTGGSLAPGAVAKGISTATLTVGSLVWHGGTLNLQLGANNATSDLLAVTGALTKGTAGAFGIKIADAGGFGTQPTYTLITFGSTNFTVGEFTLAALPTGYTGKLSLDGDSLDLTLTGFAASGPIIQNSAPVGTSVLADFMVNGPVTTGTQYENNTIKSLAFAPNSSLTIFNTLYVTDGNPVDLTSGSSLILGAPGGPNGNLSASQLNILPGSVLSGNGSIIGHLVNSGLVSPGFSPGQITVTGNYAQTSTGALQIQIGGRDLSQHDLLSVGGSANLGGTLELVRLDNFKLKRNVPVTFLTAGGGVIGRFGSVQNDFTSDTILQPTVVYSSNSVALEAVQGSFEKFAQSADLTPNQKSVASALDRIVNDRRANSLIDHLDDRPLSKLPGDFEKISPEQLTSIFTIGTSLAQVQSLNIQRRTDDLRAGSSGFSAERFAMTGSAPSYSGPLGISGLAGPNGAGGTESKESKTVLVPTPENRWGVFVSGTGEWVNVGHTDNARGYDLTSGGFTLGIDYKVSPNFAIGLVAGYTGTTDDLTDHGRVWVNGGKVGLYATTFAGGWYADVAATGGYSSYDTRRAALQGDARGSTDGGDFNALIGTGYDFKKGNFTFGPTATFNYTYTGTNAFTESDSLAPLDIHGGKGESLRSALGIKATCDWKKGGVVIRPELRAAWQREYGDAVYGLDSNFANGAGSTFTVNGPQTGRDSLLLGAGFAIQCSARCSTYFYYDGELGRQNYQSNSVTGGFRLEF